MPGNDVLSVGTHVSLSRFRGHPRLVEAKGQFFGFGKNQPTTTLRRALVQRALPGRRVLTCTCYLLN
jgi:hypothetical protein